MLSTYTRMIALIGCLSYLGSAFGYSIVLFPFLYFDEGHPKRDESLEDALNGPGQKQNLEFVTDFLKRFPSEKILIRARTDANECAADQCQVLSKRRALLVEQWLLAHEVNRSQIEKVEWTNASESFGASETMEQSAQNRVVELVHH
jgi:hypothetical protein